MGRTIHHAKGPTRLTRTERPHDTNRVLSFIDDFETDLSMVTGVQFGTPSLEAQEGGDCRARVCSGERDRELFVNQCADGSSISWHPSSSHPWSPTRAGRL